MTTVYDGPPIADVANPTPDEIRAWAYRGAVEPMQDWDILIAEPGNLPVLVELVADCECPSRKYILRSLYCLVGHSDRPDFRLRDAVTTAEEATDPWLTTWAHRVRELIDQPARFNRQDWCGFPGYAEQPTE
jgi:hypothetical protein